MVRRLLITCVDEEVITAEDIRLALLHEQGEIATPGETVRIDPRISFENTGSDSLHELLDLDRESNRFMAELIERLIAETGSIEAAAKRLCTGSSRMTANALRLRLYRARRAAGLSVT